MDRWLLELDGKADYFIQIRKTDLKGKRLAIKEQTYLDDLPDNLPIVMEKGRMYGQTSWKEW